MRHLPRVAPTKIQCTNPNASQAAARHSTHGHHNCRVTSPLTALPASQNNETPTPCSAVQHAPNNKSSADRHVRWLETSTKCSKHTVHQICLTGRSQAENSRHSNKLTAKRQRLPDRGRSPRAPPRVHFRPPPSRPAKTTGTSRTPKEGNTLHSGRSKAQRETPDHHGSHFPGSGTNVGHYKELIRPNARDPPRTRLNNTTSQFSLPSTGDPCIIHKKWTRRVRMQTQ